MKHKKLIILWLDKYRYFICVVYLNILCMLFPYTADDWNWGTSRGIERLITWFDNYNGRYLGNILAIILSRSNLLKAVIMSLCITGIIYSLEYIVEQKSAFYLSILLLLAMPQIMGIQVFVWMSGFANYTVSIFYTLIYFMFSYVFLDKRIGLIELRQKWTETVFMLVLGLINTLFVEHMTIYHVTLAAISIGYFYFKYKKILIQYIAYAIGTLLGSIWMFSNSVYYNVVSGTDYYRTIAGNVNKILEQAAENYFSTVYRNAFMNNIFMNLLIYIICCIIIFLSKLLLHKKLFLISVGCIIINGAYLMYSIGSWLFFYGKTKSNTIILIEGIFTFVSGSALVILIFIIAYIKKFLEKAIFLIGSILQLTLMLLIVTPLNSRCFYTNYMLGIILLLELYKALPQSFIDVVCSYRFMKIYCDLVCISLVFLLGIYSSIYIADRNRISYVCKVAKEREKKIIKVPRLPFESYVWYSVPLESEYWQSAYKEFYHIPSDKIMKFVKQR